MYLLKHINTAFIAGLLGLAGIAAIVVSYPFIHKANTHSINYNNNQENINHLSQLNTKWASSVEETKNFALTDFDKIALHTKNIRATLAGLDQAGLLDENLVGKETVGQFKIFKNSFELKYEAIERYKSEQAILRNSANFLQTSANEALESLNNISIKDKITNSVSMINTYLLLNKLGSEKEAKSKLSEIEFAAQDDNILTKEKEAINIYVSHAKVILEYNPKVNNMLETANTVDIETLTNNLSSSYAEYQNKHTKELNYWRKILLGGIVGLLISFFLFLNRFRTNIKREKGVEEKLQVANSEIDKVNDDILVSESHAGRAHLALATLNTIQNNTNPIATNIKTLKKLVSPTNIETTKQEIINVISDLEEQESELNILKEAIVSDESNNSALINLNGLLTKAITSIKSEVNKKLNVKTVLGKNITLENNPIAIFQILLKLLRLSAHAPNTKGELDIHIHTWSTDSDATLFMTIEGHNNPNEIFSEKGMTIFKKLLDQNNISIEIKARTNKDGAITLNIPRNPVQL